MIDLSFTKDGETVPLFLNFQYTREGEHPRDTAARLYTLGHPDSPPIECAVGWACLHHRDQFNRAKGRKLALKRALDKIPSFTYEDRTKIWLNYLNCVNY